MRLILILLVVAIFSSPITSSAAAEDLTGAAKSVLEKLAKESGDTFSIQWNLITSTPSEITGKLSKPSKHSPGWIAFEFLNKTKVLYGLKNSRTDMQVTEVRQGSDNTTQVRLQHLLYNTPVWKDELVIQINKQGIIQRVTGRMYPYLEEKIFNRPMQAAFSKKEAIKIAVSFAKADRAQIEEPKVEMYYLPTRAGTPLIYVVKLRSRDSDNEHQSIFIHALTGRVIEQQ
jgi:Zn-dependent metalloprotease